MIPYWRLSAYYFFYFAFIGAFSPYFGLYLQSLGQSAMSIGVLMSLMQVMRLVAPNLWGWLADRLGARLPIVRLAGLMSLAGFSVFFATHEFAGLFVGMGLMAFFWSAALPLIETVTLAHLGAQPSRYGGIRLWGSIGFVVAVLGVGYALDVRAVSILLVICACLLAGIFLSAMVTPEAPARAHADSAPLSEILRRGEVRRFLAAAFFMSAAHGVLYVFYSIYLVEHGYSKSVVGWLWTLGVLAEIGVFFYMPALLRRFSLRALLLLSFACAVVRFATIGFGVEVLAIIVAAQLLHGATFGAHHAVAMALLNRWFGVRHQARGQALYGSVSFGAGGMVGALASGWLWEAVGGSLTFACGSLFALAGLLIAARLRLDKQTENS